MSTTTARVDAATSPAPVRALPVRKRIPFINTKVRLLDLARLCERWGQMERAGVPVKETLKMLADNFASSTEIAHGGGIYSANNVNSAGSLTISNSVIRGSSVTAGRETSGGGIYFDSGTLVLTNSSVSDNSPTAGLR